MWPTRSIWCCFPTDDSKPLPERIVRQANKGRPVQCTELRRYHAAGCFAAEEITSYSQKKQPAASAGCFFNRWIGASDRPAYRPRCPPAAAAHQPGQPGMPLQQYRRRHRQAEQRHGIPGRAEQPGGPHGNQQIGQPVPQPGRRQPAGGRSQQGKAAYNTHHRGQADPQSCRAVVLPPEVPGRKDDSEWSR